MTDAWLREKEWILFCDESVGKGEYFSNFYGGALVRASQYERITRRLKDTIQETGLSGEIKWSKSTESRLEGYSKLVSVFFDEVMAGHAKMRVMFTHDYHEPIGLSDQHRANAYFILYYQFIKHAFGFSSIDDSTSGVYLRVYLDQFPDTKEKSLEFRRYIGRLRTIEPFLSKRIGLRESDITEVRSHDHPILQCLDVILGSMAFRLNDRHKQKPPGSRARGSRTRAKEKLYHRIREHVCQIKPNFNAGTSTGTTTAYPTRWALPYAHWKFVPRNHRRNDSKAKKKPRGAY